jgi:hypothetical protein
MRADARQQRLRLVVVAPPSHHKGVVPAAPPRVLQLPEVRRGEAQNAHAVAAGKAPVAREGVCLGGLQRDKVAILRLLKARGKGGGRLSMLSMR